MQLCQKPLKPNPFVTYRDPVTGCWQVIQRDEMPVLPQTTEPPLQPVSLHC